MKKNYLLLVFCFITYFTNAQVPFITTWQIESNNLNIIFNVEGDNYNVDFGDGTILENQSAFYVPHTYVTPGIYTITLSGNFNSIEIHSQSVLSIEQWGDTQWTSMWYAFSGCSNLTINATDIPDLSQVINMNHMFAYCSSLNQPLNNWDVSNVTIMQSMFEGCSAFNQPINNWDVGNVTDMRNMFKEASSFNQPLDSWDVSNVTNMSYMFSKASSFNQPLDNWDVSSLTYTGYMFFNASSFNGTLNNWNVSNVTNMESMFYSALSFDQPLNNWDVSNVTDMIEMFRGAESFNQPLNNWDVSSVTDMSYMFIHAYSFNQPLNNWDVSSVTDMACMFWDATSFNQPLDSWDVTNVTDMKYMFCNVPPFNQPLNSWNVSNVTDMRSMFKGCSSFNQPLDNWDISNVKNISAMFLDAVSFNQDISNWNFYHPYLDLALFLRNSGLDISNYDGVLNRFKEIGYGYKTLIAEGLQYCDVETRDYLINELGWTITYDSLAEDCTAKTESFAEDQLSIYPNPVNDILYIETKAGLEIEEVTVYNLEGSQLMSLNQDFENISTESLSSGIYILSVQTNKGSTEYKLIKN